MSTLIFILSKIRKQLFYNMKYEFEIINLHFEYEIFISSLSLDLLWAIHSTLISLTYQGLLYP